MKSEIKRFEKDGRRLVYNAQTKVVKIWADDMDMAREFFFKHMDERKIGIVNGLAVTLSYAPEVTFIIRGKQLLSFSSSKKNEYQQKILYAGQEVPAKKLTFDNRAQPEIRNKTTEQWVELVVYCPGTQRFLFEITRGKAGFPIALVCNDDPKESAVQRLGDLSGSMVTAKHTKPFNEVSADGVKHHFYFMVCKHEFIANAPPPAMMKWAPHKIDSKNYITNLMFEKDPTIKQIVASEKEPQTMDFSKLVDDIMD